MKKYQSSIFFIIALLSALLLTGCATSRPLQLVERTSVDTLYLSSQHFDSVYVFRDRFTDCSRDTIYLRDVSVEYRYRLLRDTIYITFFDRLCRACFYLLSGALLVLFAIFLFKLKTRIRL